MKKWEKSFKKKMTDEEKVMFRWGLAYGVERTLRLIQEKSK